MAKSTRIPFGLLIATTLVACNGDPLTPADRQAQKQGDCSNPAPLHGKKTTAPGYIVVYKDGTQAASVTKRLAQKYGFTPRHVYEHALQGFSAELSDAALAGVRCEPEVKYAEFDGIVSVG